MSVDTLEELFLAELKDLYDSEHRLVTALAELADAVDHDDIATAFEEHEAQTEGHVERLETVFQAIGEEPAREECQASKGMIEETQAFLREEEPSQAVANRYAVTAAQKTERYEITAYENLLQWANEAGMAEEVTEALRANLDEEIEALQKLQGIAEEFDYGQIEA